MPRRLLLTQRGCQATRKRRLGSLPVAGGLGPVNDRTVVYSLPVIYGRAQPLLRSDRRDLPRWLQRVFESPGGFDGLWKVEVRGRVQDGTP